MGRGRRFRRCGRHPSAPARHRPSKSRPNWRAERHRRNGRRPAPCHTRWKRHRHSVLRRASRPAASPRRLSPPVPRSIQVEKLCHCGSIWGARAIIAGRARPAGSRDSRRQTPRCSGRRCDRGPFASTTAGRSPGFRTRRSGFCRDRTCRSALCRRDLLVRSAPAVHPSWCSSRLDLPSALTQLSSSLHLLYMSALLT